MLLSLKNAYLMYLLRLNVKIMQYLFPFPYFDVDFNFDTFLLIKSWTYTNMVCISLLGPWPKKSWLQ